MDVRSSMDVFTRNKSSLLTRNKDLSKSIADMSMQDGLQEDRFRMNVSSCLEQVTKLPRFSRMKIVNRLEDMAKRAEKDAG